MRFPLSCVAVLLGSSLLAAQAPTVIPSGAVIYVEDSEFGQALSAAMLKKKVPAVVSTNKEKAAFFVEETSNASKEGTGERVAKVLAFGAFAGSGRKFEASVRVTNADGVVVFAHNSDKRDIRRAAEDVAERLEEHIRKSAKR